MAIVVVLDIVTVLNIMTIIAIVPVLTIITILIVVTVSVVGTVQSFRNQTGYLNVRKLSRGSFFSLSHRSGGRQDCH